LSSCDRVEIAIDVDRDYATSFVLAVDRAGRTQDRCGRDVAWNPQWFLSTRDEPGEWRVEAAIPLVELSREPPAKGTVWAFAARRIQPGIGIHSATVDASAALGPASFGWLDFQ
jgi:hypothetical protein